MTGRADVVVVSTRAAEDPALDTTGPVIVAWLRERGFEVADPAIVADGGPVAETVAAALAGGSRVVITTGGTGVTPTDRTPEAVEPLIDLAIPGIIEEIRRRGADVGPRSLLTRGVAGIAAGGATGGGATGGGTAGDGATGGATGGGAFVVTLPGSRGGVADGLDVLDGVLDHVLDQVHGDGHAPRTTS
jgi:molybdenum cofactor synthesis domain-containing protein